MNSIQFYSQFIHDPQALANGYPLILHHLRQNRSNRESTLLNLFHPELPILTLVGNVYASDVFTSLELQEKQATRVFLMELLARLLAEEKQISRKVDSLISFLGKIHNQDGYEEWVTMYGQILENLYGPQCGSFIIRILQGADNRVAILSTRIFKYVIDKYDKLSIGLEQMLQVLYLCVRSFSHLNGSDDQVLEQYFSPYSDQLLAFIWSNFNSSPVAMKFSLKLLTVLFSDMDLAEHQQSQPHIQQLSKISLQVCQQYLNQITEESFIKQSLNAEEEDNERIEGATLLGVITHQFLQLFDTLMTQNEEYPTIPIFYLALLAATPNLAQWNQWTINSEQYILSAEDESEPTLRNRCTQIMVSLLEDHERKIEHKMLFIQYLTTLSNSVMNKSVKPIEDQLQASLGFRISLNGPLLLYEESTYFILNSCITQLFESEQHHKQLKISLFNRLNQDCHMLVKIACLMVCMSEPQPQSSQQFCSYLISLVGQHPNEGGVLLIACRGLGKCCVRNKLEIENQIPATFIKKTLDFLSNLKSEDSAHIVLQFIIKLAQISEHNKSILMQIITPQAQLAMLDRYFHDGMLAAMVSDILQKLPHSHTVHTVVNSVFAGKTKDQRISDIVVKWMKNGYAQLNGSHISTLLQTYQAARRSIISPIIKQYLQMHCPYPQSIQSDQKLIQLLNTNPDSSWMIFMLRCGILQNSHQLLIQTVTQITYQITSQYELQSKMVLPFFLCLSQTQQFLAILSQQPALFNQFLNKVFRYAELFKGDHLKIVTSLFFISLAQVEPLLKERTLKLVEGYGKMEVDEWQQDEDGDDEEAIIQRLLGGKLVNEQLEEELKQIFGENAWNSQRVKALILELKSN